MNVRASALAVALAAAAPAAAAIYPPITIATGRQAAVTAMHQVQAKTPHATASGVSRCFRPKVAGGGNLVDCASRPTCRLHVRVHESGEGPVWSFMGKTSCSHSRRLPSSSPGTIY